MNQLEQNVKNLVAQKVAKGDTFTAFNVTIELGEAPHSTIRPIVHSLFNNGEFPSYQSEISTGIAGNPIVYKPSTAVTGVASATTTMKAAQNASTKATQATARPTVGASASANHSTNVGEEVSPNESGTRLRVRKHTVVSAGFNAGTELFVTYSPKMNTVMLSNKKQTTNDSSATTDIVQVDVKQNVRLNVEKLGIRGNKFASTADKGVILVSVQ